MVGAEQTLNNKDSPCPQKAHSKVQDKRQQVVTGSQGTQEIMRLASMRGSAISTQAA